MHRRVDYHLHSSLSADAKDRMEDICRTALERGLAEIAITDHIEFYENDPAGRQSSGTGVLEDAKAAVEACRNRFGARLRIRYGAEFGQPQTQPALSHRLAEEHPLDFILGSLHKLNGTDLGRTHYTPEGLDALLETYFSQLLHLAAEGEYDCLGHITLPERYARRAGVAIDWSRWETQVHEVLRQVIQRGKGIELNLSGLRQGGAPMPTLEILRWYRELGGEIVTIGSDAHCCRDVGLHLEIGEQLLREAGFCRIAVYQQRRPSFERI